jgi:hypothetical protein
MTAASTEMTAAGGESLLIRAHLSAAQRVSQA